MLNVEYEQGYQTDANEFILVKLHDSAYGAIRSWMQANREKHSLAADAKLEQTAKTELEALFDLAGLTISGEINMSTMHFFVGRYAGGIAIAIPSDFFVSPPASIPRLKREELNF
ncbi:hypothetical protein [Burkholderia pseudomallei]|uniref:hypothetical protein n=1 Tax=Burkholderia pseudomallei TaxID=28450 RepID=UPI0021F74CB8|nr:hypothetical protein [Burkholderia pseudomallei]MCW0159664.1 hypothetical protein [Burkholderia pseudomallei]